MLSLPDMVVGSMGRKVDVEVMELSTKLMDIDKILCGEEMGDAEIGKVH